MDSHLFVTPATLEPGSKLFKNMDSRLNFGNDGWCGCLIKNLRHDGGDAIPERFYHPQVRHPWMFLSVFKAFRFPIEGFGNDKRESFSALFHFFSPLISSFPFAFKRRTLHILFPLEGWGWNNYKGGAAPLITPLKRRKHKDKKCLYQLRMSKSYRDCLSLNCHI